MRLKIRFNWRAAVLAFVLMEVMLFASACGSTITQITNLLPAIGTLLSAVVAFVTGLGTSVPEAVQNDVKVIEQASQAGITEALALLKSWTQSTSTTVLGKVNDILKSVLGSLSTLLGDIGLTGTAAQKVQQLVALAISAVEGVLAMIPLFGRAAAASPHALKEMDRMGAAHAKALHEALKAQYNEIIQPVDASDPQAARINAALAKLPRSL